MKGLVIACQMIEQEMKKVLEVTGKDYPGVFLKPGLDNNPAELKKLILGEMAKLTEPSTVFLGYGFSNGALSALPAGIHTVVAPQAEDVICLVLGSQTRRDAILAEAATYFITEGWLKGDNLFGEFQKAVEKFGQGRAEKIHKTIMAAYKRYLLIDTGVYEVASYVPRFQELAKISGLAVEQAKGDLSWLRDLINGPAWDKRFVVAEPGEILNIDPAAGSKI